MAEPGTPRLLRAMNDRAALDLLLEHGPLSAPGSASCTGPVQAHRLPAPGPPGGRRPGPADRHQLRAARAQRPAVRGQPRRRARRRARRHAHADPRRRRRHHRPHGRHVRAARPPGEPAPDTVARVVEALDGALPRRGLDRAAAAPVGHRHPRRLRPEHRPAALRPPPARLARPRACSTSSPTRCRCRRVRERRQPRRRRRAAPRRGPGHRELRPAVGRGGRRRRHRHRRPAAPRRDRRRRRGRLPAGARHAAGPQRRPQQRRRLPGARRRPRPVLGPGPRARASGPRTAEDAVSRRRSRRRAAATRS